jgi:hypothetical protein
MTNNNYRYTLEPYKGPSSRYTCPACGLKRQLVRYIDTFTGQHLGDDVGRCNREYQCSYHLKPKDTILPRDEQYPPVNRFLRPASKDFNTIPQDMLDDSLRDYEDNHFMRYLQTALGKDAAKELAARYKIGTNHYWDSSTVFWQVDALGRIRTGKVMLYNPTTGRRLKDEVTYINWMHRVLRLHDFTLQQCLFGEHLLPHTTGTVAIAESEKTAIIAAHYLPCYTWLAAGSAANLSAEKCKVLQGREVILFPDADARDKWQAIAAGMPNCTVSPVAQLFTEEQRSRGYDIADYLLGAA